MLRNLLRLHPNLACPEETHFYRHPWPFGSDEYGQFVKKNATLVHHREIDGIGEDEFVKLYGQCSSRAELLAGYMRLYLSRREPGATRWFDKTPQNVYGMALLAANFPRARFLHMVRDPVDVVSSLKAGKVMKAMSIVAGCGYWNEATSIVAAMKPALKGRLLEIRYEDFCAAPQEEIARILAFLGEAAVVVDTSKVKAKRYGEEGILTEQQRQRIGQLCRNGMSRYAYSTPLAQP